jgi:hypothetical protein
MCSSENFEAVGYAIAESILGLGERTRGQSLVFGGDPYRRL